MNNQKRIEEEIRERTIGDPEMQEFLTDIIHNQSWQYMKEYSKKIEDIIKSGWTDEKEGGENAF